MKYFTKGEWALWLGSCAAIVISFFAFRAGEYLTLLASLIGVTSLIFSAKGNPIGQALMVAFSLIYGVISYSFSYYGEMITYLGMTMPMAVVALVSWVKNPYCGRRSQVRIHHLSGKEHCVMWLLTAAVTGVFYLILAAFETKNLVLSTVSVATSFAAVYLTFRRSSWFALAYAANDVVLIALWVLASFEDVSYCSVAVCFLAFLVNDLYGFFNWRRMEKQQRQN